MKRVAPEFSGRQILRLVGFLQDSPSHSDDTSRGRIHDLSFGDSDRDRVAIDSKGA
jgi:hypothetical protein